MKSLRIFPALLLVPLIASAASPAESTPPFIYYIVPISDGLNERLESLGLLPAHGGDADRKAKVLHSVACAGGPCRRLVEPPRTNDPKWYSTLLALEPTRAGRFATFLVSFDGWYLSISVDMYDAKLAESGKFEMTPRYFTIYNSDCSRLPSDENACLLRELELAFDRIAPYWETRVDPESWKVIAAKLAHRDRLPLARDLVKDEFCKKKYDEYRLVKDFGDYLWFGFPPEFAPGSDSVVIASSCADGFGGARQAPR